MIDQDRRALSLNLGLRLLRRFHAQIICLLLVCQLFFMLPRFHALIFHQQSSAAFSCTNFSSIALRQSFLLYVFVNGSALRFYAQIFGELLAARFSCINFWFYALIFGELFAARFSCAYFWFYALIFGALFAARVSCAYFWFYALIFGFFFKFLVNLFAAQVLCTNFWFIA